MKPLHRNIIIGTAALCLLITTVMLVIFLSDRASDAKPRMYIALGDSVASGFGVAHETRYTYVLFERLRAEKYVDEYLNMGVNGYTTTMLYDYLNSLGKEELELFGNAKVITLNIGGNNILAPFLDYFPSLDEIMKTVTDIGSVVSDARDTVAEVRDVFDDFSLSDVRALPGIIGDIVPMFNNVLDVFGSISDLNFINPFALMFSSLPDELEAGLQRGTGIFESEFKNIILWLERNAPDALIIVNTIYNPLPSDIMGFRLNIFERAGVLTQTMNDVIHELSEAHGFAVADINSAFKEEPNVISLMNFNLDLSALTFNFDIIHPNNTGHEMISRLNYDSFREKKLA
jgi:lysophospholipase L1-like esterase